MVCFCIYVRNWQFDCVDYATPTQAIVDSTMNYNLSNKRTQDPDWFQVGDKSMQVIMVNGATKLVMG